MKRSLHKLNPPTMTLEDYAELADDCGGRCGVCGSDQFGCEPDARNYICEECDQPTVFGADEWLVSGFVG